MNIGRMLYGFCQGYFGRDSYSDKRIEAEGVDWLVARVTDGYDEGTPEFVSFGDEEEKQKFIKENSQKVEE